MQSLLPPFFSPLFVLLYQIAKKCDEDEQLQL